MPPQPSHGGVGGGVHEGPLPGGGRSGAGITEGGRDSGGESIFLSVLCDIHKICFFRNNRVDLFSLIVSN